MGNVGEIDGKIVRYVPDDGPYKSAWYPLSGECWVRVHRSTARSCPSPDQQLSVELSLCTHYLFDSVYTSD